MKKKLAAIVLFFIALSVHGQRGSASLDEIIAGSALQIQDGLEKGSTIIVYQFQFSNEKLSDYILKELFDKLVNSNKFIVLDRSSQEVINAELDFQFNQSAGMVSDNSLASLTERIGAQAIITGSLDDAGDEYRFRIKVIGTETTAALVSYVGRVNKNDRRITVFSNINREKSAGEKIGAGALNILLGLGSYLEGDIGGGITLTAGCAIAAGLFVVEATALDWDSPAAGVPAVIGVTAAGFTIVYGFIRPFIYNRSKKIAAVTDNVRPRIVLISDNTAVNSTVNGAVNSSIGFQITHTVRF
ncbi:MAG: penicillin-binding protein activator LpoB [Treponema sp.]|jgi:TolB-like protein|nr:penicillin-binding protein activator LpoB [Treponema sp.]